MWLSTLIIVFVFISIVLLLMIEKGNRVLLAISGALVCYLTLVFIENEQSFSLFTEFLIGTEDDGYVNLHSLFLIFGMSFIIQIANEAGVFKFLAFKLILWIARKPELLLLIMCIITYILSALLNNILTVMIIIPLTITISRILNIDPEPYIITQAILVNIGGTLFSISSIPNILIAANAGITFNQFFLNVGLISIIIFLMTVGFFYIIYGKKLDIPAENIKILKEFNPENLIADRGLLIKSTITLLTVIICFMIVPPSILTPDIIALIGAMILAFISKLNQEKLLRNLDMDIILYLLGIFVIAGCLEYTGILEVLGHFIGNLGGGNINITILLILWSSAILSSTIDNIPITKILIPSIGVIGANQTLAIQHKMYYSLAIGANWGDNLTPMGDNILVMNIAQKNKRPLKMKEFWKIGFITTLFQLFIITIFYSFLISTILALFLLFILVTFLFFLVAKIYYPNLWNKITGIFRKKKLTEVKNHGI